MAKRTGGKAPWDSTNTRKAAGKKSKQLTPAQRFLIVPAFAIAGLAAQERSSTTQVWPCVDAARVDPSYVATADATGGQVYFLHPSESGRTAPLMLWSMQHEELIWRASGELQEGSREFSFPVDPGVASLVISAWVQCKQTIVITPPDAAASLEQQEFQAGRVVHAAQPEAGTWRVQIAGRGLWSVVASAKGGLSLDSAKFVRYGGRPGHEGWFPLEGPRNVDSDVVLQVKLSDAVREAHYSLVNAKGEAIAQLQPADGDGLIRFRIAQSGFRLAVDGLDLDGHPFRRMTPAVFMTAK